MDEMSRLHINPSITISHLSSQRGKRGRRKGRCRRHVMEQHQHSQTHIAPIIEEKIPIEDLPSTSLQIPIHLYSTPTTYQQ